MKSVLLLRSSAQNPHAQHGLVPPYNLASLAAHIEDLTTVQVFDGSLSTMAETLDVVRVFDPDLVGITTFTTTLVPCVLDLAQEIRERNQQVRIILGGHGATFIADEILSSGYVDAVVRGEGELTLREIVSQGDFREVKGVSYVDDDQVIHNEPRESIANLDTMLFPAWHYLDLSNVMIFPIETSRGCVLTCNFCDVGHFWGFKPRYKSMQRVFEEIRRIQTDWSGNTVLIADDNFCNSTRRVVEFCEMSVRQQERGVLKPFSVYGQVSAESVAQHPETAPLLRRAGFELVYLGIESPFEDTLSKMDREAGSFQDAYQAIRHLQAHNIEVHANFIVGYPHETPQMLRATFQKALDLGADFCSFNLIVPYPGSQVYDQWRDEGLLTTLDWARYDRTTQVVRTPHMPDVDLVQTIADWHQHYYFQADWIARYLGPQETTSRWSIHRGVWYTHYHDTTNMTQMERILLGYQQFAGEDLHREMPDYDARVRIETEVGDLFVEIEAGQIVDVQEKGAQVVDLIIHLTNDDLNRLFGDVWLDPLSGFVMGRIVAQGSLEAKIGFIRWVDGLQDVINTRLISLAHDNPDCLSLVNSLLADPKVGSRRKMWLLRGSYADLYVRLGQNGSIIEFQLVKNSVRQKRAQKMDFSEQGWLAMLAGELGPLAEVLNAIG